MIIAADLVKTCPGGVQAVRGVSFSVPAYSVFAMALGITAGALLRRMLPAMIVTLAGFIAVRATIALWVRQHYMPAVTVYYKVTSGFTPPGAFWRLASGVVGPNGQLINQNTNGPVINGIPATYLPAGCPPDCRQALTHFRAFLTYQPADRCWAFQGIESGIFLGLSAVLIAVTAVMLLRRDA